MWYDILHSIQSRFSKNCFLQTIGKMLFFLAFLSIPICSFTSGLYLITWALTILFLITIWITIFVKKTIKISYFSIIYVIAAFSILLSSVLNLFKAFSLTPLFMLGISFSVIMYLENCEDKEKETKEFIVLTFAALVVFLIVYCVRYFPDLISFHFDRLGTLFGDINDICLFLSLGSIISLHQLFFNKKPLKIMLFAISFLLFTYASISCGSKIFILIIAIELLLLPLIRFGKKYWYVTLIFYIAFAGLGIIIFKLPFFSSLAKRIESMISLFVGNSQSAFDVDYSTIGRIDMFADGIVMFLRKPLFGWGANAFFKYSSYGGGWSHNHFSDCLCSYGLIGSIAINCNFFASFYRCGKESNERKTIFFFLFVFFFVSMFSVSLDVEKIFAFVSPVLIARYSVRCVKIKNPLFMLFRRKKNENS